MQHTSTNLSSYPKIISMLSVVLMTVFIALFSGVSYSQITYGNSAIVLHKGWRIISSEKVKESGAELSSLNYSAEGWYPAEVPSTIMGNLVKDGMYKDVFMGDNLDKVPKEQFEKPWWYRTEFELPDAVKGEIVKLDFGGIIYRANIWLNGKLVAGADSVFGVFRRFELDATKFALPGKKNVLAVEVIPPKKGEPNIGWVDWSPKPPDNSMGLWREVKVKISGGVSIDFPFVKSSVNLNTLKSAELTVSAEVTNNKNEKAEGILSGEIGSIKFSQRVALAPGEKKIVTYAPAEFKQLKIDHPHLWWTYNLGGPYLYDLRLKFEESGKTSSVCETKFGIREVSDYIDKDGFRGYKLNGKKVQVLGGGWADNMFLNDDHNKMQNQIDYVKQMGLNAIRLEGFWGTSDDLYNLCDENGILMMAGWSCYWEWEPFIGKPVDEYGGIKSPEDIKLISQSWEDQVKWLRNHPSIFVWLYGSDKIPRPELEKNYQEILKKYDPTRPFLASAAEHTSSITGKTAVKMRGPYDYVPPEYWWIDTKNGGAFGFNTELGPGVEVPPLETIKKMIPADHLWPIDSVWYFHCGRNHFHGMGSYNEALDARFGKPVNLNEYCTKAQLSNYEGTRAMFEANEVNRYKSTGAIFWMLNSAWPKLWWQLYDYYLLPGGAFYGVKKALEPVHIAYDYGSGGIIAVNNTTKDMKDLHAQIRVLNFDLSDKYNKIVDFNLSKEEIKPLASLPQIKDLSRTYFIELKLTKGNELLSTNFYWLSTKPEALDTAKSNWYITPVKEYADLTELNNLPKVHLNVDKSFTRGKSVENIEVKVTNNTKHLAFQIVLSLQKGKNGGSVLPIFWGDNYFSLLPGESRIIKGHFYVKDLEGREPELHVSGWNVE